MKSKINTLEALRGIAALLVVMYHLQDIFVTRARVVPFAGLFGAGDRGVDLFFVLSGFIIMTAHKSDVGHAGRVSQFVYKRTCRLYPSVWILTLFAIVTYAYGFGSAGKSDKLEPWDLFASALLLPQSGPALVNVTWTLKYELCFYVLFAVLIANKKIGALLLLSWQAVAACAAVGLISWSYSLAEYYFRPISLEFGIGMACAWVVTYTKSRLGSALTAGYFSLLVMGAAVFGGGLLYEDYLAPHGLEQFRFLIYGLSSGAVIASLSVLERAGRISAPALLVSLGSASYAIYLVHYSVITIIATTLVKLGITQIDDLLLGATALFAIALGTAFYRLVDLPIQTQLRRFGRIRFVPDRLPAA